MRCPDVWTESAWSATAFFQAAGSLIAMMALLVSFRGVSAILAAKYLFCSGN